MKSETKWLQNRCSEHPIRPYPSYIVEFDELIRSKLVSESQNSLKFFKTQLLQNVNVKKSKLQARKFKANFSISKAKCSMLNPTFQQNLSRIDQ